MEVVSLLRQSIDLSTSVFGEPQLFGLKMDRLPTGCPVANCTI